MRPFRFGLQISADDPTEVVNSAQQAERSGFDVALLSDHVGSGLSPMPMAAAIAQATKTIRIGTLVLNAAMRNPVQLAWEALTIDSISDGRFELGLGAGHTPQEFDATGIERRSARARKSDLGEQVEIIRRLLDGETVSHDGTAHSINHASLGRSTATRVPILVGGNGTQLLGHAGAHADIIGLQGLGRTKPDGHRHEVKWTSEHLDSQLAQLRRGAGERFGELELSALVQSVVVTDDVDGATKQFLGLVDGLSHEDVASTPYVLIGPVEVIVDKLITIRQRWGISYFAVRDLEQFAPVVSALKER